jgi:Ran-binding protein 1
LSDCKTFKEKVEEIAEHLQRSDGTEENKEASATAGLLDNLTVSETETKTTPSNEETESKEESSSA